MGLANIEYQDAPPFPLRYMIQEEGKRFFEVIKDQRSWVTYSSAFLRL